MACLLISIRYNNKHLIFALQKSSNLYPLFTVIETVDGLLLSLLTNIKITKCN